MGLFKNMLSLISDAQRTIDDFDFDSAFDSAMASGRKAFDGFGELLKNVKDTVSDLKVVVPFDSKKETFDIKIENGMLKVTVKGKKSFKETTTTVPSNCIIDEMNHFIDKKGNLVVVIPKDLSEDETLKKAKSTVTKTVTNTANWLKDALKERAEAVAASTTAPTSKPKGGKKTAARKPQPKVVRGADGKFKSAKS